MKNAPLIFLLAILITVGSAMAIQFPYPIYGYIKDANGNPAIGVTVTVKETIIAQTKVDVTDNLGRYSVILDEYRDGDAVQIIAGDMVVSKIIDVQSGGLEVDLQIKATTPVARNSNWMTEETIIGLPNWVLVITAILSSVIGFSYSRLPSIKLLDLMQKIRYKPREMPPYVTEYFPTPMIPRVPDVPRFPHLEKAFLKTKSVRAKMKPLSISSKMYSLNISKS